MKVSVDGMRRNMTDDLTRLREAILSITDNLYQDDKQEIIDSFDQVACNQNSFNCLYDDENPLFNDLSDSCEVELIGDYD
jgi:hypothetical protein